MGDYSNLREEVIFERIRICLFWDGVTLYEVCLFYTTLENKEIRLEHHTINNEEDAMDVFNTWAEKIKENSFWNYKRSKL